MIAIILQISNGMIVDSVIQEILTSASDGKTYRVNHYNLQVIIALGFKIDNEKTIAFRKWANTERPHLHAIAHGPPGGRSPAIGDR